MNKKCPQCHLINFAEAEICKRCEFDFAAAPDDPRAFETSENPKRRKRSFAAKLARRAIICAAACFAAVGAFYLSLVFSADPLVYDQKARVKRAIRVLEQKGFDREVLLLRYVTVYRSNDNWLNASTREENAYAATNFPFEIMTVYPDFFDYAKDDTDAAAILLHEAQHLLGADEPEAYGYVWKNRKRLGWTQATHGNSKVWINTERQTREVCPELFQCHWKPGGDCTAD
jgi:hypothetical protein